jgi:hypothetical protein
MGSNPETGRAIEPAHDVSGLQPSRSFRLATQPFGLGCYVSGLRPLGCWWLGTQSGASIERAMFRAFSPPVPFGSRPSPSGWAVMFWAFGPGVDLSDVAGSPNQPNGGGHPCFARGRN